MLGMRTAGLLKAIEAAGGVNALGRKLGITGQAVQAWKDIPLKRIVDIERVTGISRKKLRPDIWESAE